MTEFDWDGELGRGGRRRRRGGRQVRNDRDRSRHVRLSLLRSGMSFVLDLALLATAWCHVLLAPYTKVEESFNLHAVHDVLMYGIGPDATQNVSTDLISEQTASLRFVVIEYDHKIFPGAIPRTFIGSILLAWVSAPVIKTAAALGLIDSKPDLQVIGEHVPSFVEHPTEPPPCSSTGACDRQCLWPDSRPPRCVTLVGETNRIPVDPAHLHAIPPTVLDGQDTAEHVCVVPWCVASPSVNCSTLTHRLTPVNVALSFLIPSTPSRASPTQQKLLSAISLLVFTSVVFRSEVALLLVPIALHAIQVVPFALLVKRGLITATVSIGEDGHRSDVLPADRRK